MVVADHRTGEFHCRNLIRPETMLPPSWPSCCRQLRWMPCLPDAEASGTPIDGPDGLLAQMTKAVLERALDVEIADHLILTPVYLRMIDMSREDLRKSVLASMDV